MSALMVITLTLSSLFLLPLMNQPLSLGLSIMFSTLFMCILSSTMVSSWYGYILFLIYVGGLLVMFAYVAALSPNVLFGKAKAMLVFLLLIIPAGLLMYFYPFIDINFMSHNSSYSTFKFMKTYGMEMISPQMVSIFIGLAVILLITLIVVVKICCYHHASLRPFKT
uniref:NADH dehydrogenase subunit 6 n=1 Tax=Voluta musica TaxID=3169513 RepID=UPI00315D0538